VNPLVSGKVPRSLRSLGMRCGVLVLANLAVTPLAAQYQQPWSGAGTLPRNTIQVGQALGSSVTARAEAVVRVGLTVSDMDRSVEFYTRVLDFERLTDDEVVGGAYEQLQGVFGVRFRVVRLRLGKEELQLT